MCVGCGWKCGECEWMYVWMCVCEWMYVCVWMCVCVWGGVVSVYAYE